MEEKSFMIADTVLVWNAILELKSAGNKSVRNLDAWIYLGEDTLISSRSFSIKKKSFSVLRLVLWN